MHDKSRRCITVAFSNYVRTQSPCCVRFLNRAHIVCSRTAHNLYAVLHVPRACTRLVRARIARRRRLRTLPPCGLSQHSSSTFKSIHHDLRHASCVIQNVPFAMCHASTSASAALVFAQLKIQDHAALVFATSESTQKPLKPPGYF